MFLHFPSSFSYFLAPRKSFYHLSKENHQCGPQGTPRRVCRARLLGWRLPMASLTLKNMQNVEFLFSLFPASLPAEPPPHRAVAVSHPLPPPQSALGLELCVTIACRTNRTCDTHLPCSQSCTLLSVDYAEVQVHPRKGETMSGGSCVFLFTGMSTFIAEVDFSSSLVRMGMSKPGTNA